MFDSSRKPSVLHLYDCADVGATLVRYGREAGRPWSYLPARDTSFDGSDGVGTLRRIASITKWTAARYSRSFDADLLHIHFGTRVGVAQRWPRKPFVVHYHGTDIRRFYYDSAQRENIQWGADNAAAVLYSTPDLKVHAERARNDAIYLPNPVNLAELPPWSATVRPRVVFSSRWDDSKGGEEQLELLSEVRRVMGKGVQIEGLEWGSGAEEARKRGARLIRRMPKNDYLRWLASAHCVVGQTSGILAMSELQSIAIGVPVVARLGTGYYPDPVPVLGGETIEDLAIQVASVVQDPLASAAQLQAREWVEEHHSPLAAVNRLSAIYESLT